MKATGHAWMQPLYYHVPSMCSMHSLIKIMKDYHPLQTVRKL